MMTKKVHYEFMPRQKSYCRLEKVSRLYNITYDYLECAYTQSSQSHLARVVLGHVCCTLILF